MFDMIANWGFGVDYKREVVNAVLRNEFFTTKASPTDFHQNTIIVLAR